MRDPDYLNSGDVRFPGAPNYRKYISYRPLNSVTLRSTLSPNMVNELRGGITPGRRRTSASDVSNGPQTFSDRAAIARLDADLGLPTGTRRTDRAGAQRRATTSTSR